MAQTNSSLASPTQSVDLIFATTKSLVPNSVVRWHRSIRSNFVWCLIRIAIHTSVYIRMEAYNFDFTHKFICKSTVMIRNQIEFDPMSIKVIIGMVMVWIITDIIDVVRTIIFYNFRNIYIALDLRWTAKLSDFE